MENGSSQSNLLRSRIYENSGNEPLVALITGQVGRVLDVGCGNGANAFLIKKMFPSVTIDGITISPIEKKLAAPMFENLWIFDIEALAGSHADQTFYESGKFYDVMVLSHVLEHLRSPAQVLSHLIRNLEPGGQVVIAVPNVLGWRQRLKFMRGRFEYESAGVLDDTHLRFFTFFTADKYLLADTADLKLVTKTVTGGVPLWWLRRFLLPKSWCAHIDRFGCKKWPNLFGDQILLRAIKK